jgi:hypothetical protein
MGSNARRVRASLHLVNERLQMLQSSVLENVVIE